MEIWIAFFVVLSITISLCLFFAENGQKPLFIVIKERIGSLDQVKQGEKFLGEFQDLKVRTLFKLNSSQEDQSAFIFTPFLFYANLLAEVMKIEKALGVGLSSILIEIKSNVLIDIKFARLKQDVFRSAYFQMAIMSALIFFFISSCEKYLELNFSWWLYLSIFTWQIFGSLVFYFVSKKREAVYFSAYSHWFFLLYRVRLFLKSHLETADFFSTMSGELEKIKQIEKKTHFNFERQTFYRILNQCRDHGLRGDQELIELTQHLQDKRLFMLDKFQRELAFFKFFILSFFFLLTYLGFVIYLFSFFID